MSIVIRKATNGDIEQICRLECMFFSQDINPEEIEGKINLNDAYYFVAETEEKIVGYLLAKAVIDEVDLWYIAVDPDYQHQGIGNQLMKKFIENMEDKKIQKITLEVRRSNQIAISLYKKYDFKEISVRKNYYKNPTEDAVILQYVNKNEI